MSFSPSCRKVSAWTIGWLWINRLARFWISEEEVRKEGPNESSWLLCSEIERGRGFKENTGRHATNGIRNEGIRKRVPNSIQEGRTSSWPHLKKSGREHIEDIEGDKQDWTSSKARCFGLYATDNDGVDIPCNVHVHDSFHQDVPE